ncbi:hypothetical protein Stsp02_08010 [Streptomyces sp. NBRC 14336]|nr:hypothetical protein Stsp02_08010 [Streptomyces sp. NBRC 14336]
MRPSVRRAPHSSSAAGSDCPGGEDEEWGGWGWLSGIALQVLAARNCAGLRNQGNCACAPARGRKITQSESSLGR